MFQALRRQITPATVIAFVALIFAITGGAFAASSNGGGTDRPSGIGQQATASVTPGPAVASAAKSKAKPKGKAGPRGPAGPAGKNGTNGATGPAGAQGAQGAQGPAGAAGAKGETGPVGTNGINGTNGTIGFTATLPSKATEKGDWVIQAVLSGLSYIEGSASTAISFLIPLAEAPVPHYINEKEKETILTGGPGMEKEEEVTSAYCPGTVAEPAANPGNLCVFAEYEHNLHTPHICTAAEGSAGVFSCAFGQSGVANKANPAGALIAAEDVAAGSVAVSGTWAVTAE